MSRNLSSRELSNAADILMCNVDGIPLPNAKSFGKVGRPNGTNVFDAMIADAHRLVFVINGEHFDPGKADGTTARSSRLRSSQPPRVPLIRERSRRHASPNVHQGVMVNFIAMPMKAPADHPGMVQPFELPGGKLSASCDMMSGHLMLFVTDVKFAQHLSA